MSHLGQIGWVRPFSTNILDRDPLTKTPRVHASLGAAGLRNFPAIRNLVAYWRLESNGVDAVNGYDLSPVNTVPYNTGKSGSGLVLAGAGHMRRDYTAALNPAQITVAGWAKFTSTAQYSGIASIWPDAAYAVTNAYTIDCDVLPGRISFGVVIAGAAKSALSSSSYNNGEWHLFVGTHDQSTVKLYVDGDVEIVSAAAVGARHPTTSEFTIGNLIGTSIRWTGSIDEVAIWNKALSAAEVMALYNSGAGIFY